MSKIKLEGGYLLQGNCLSHMAKMKPQSVDLIISSPPYEDARTYGIDFKLKGQDWVDWMVEVFEASLRVCKGIVAFVVGHGEQNNYKWSAAPALLIADLHRKGVCLRSPKWYHRVGIPGSGGPDDMRKDIEFIVCATAKRGRLPWSDNTACASPWKYKPGGELSHRTNDGRRVYKRCVTNDHKKKLSVDVQTVKAVRSYNTDAANPGDVITCKVGKGHMGSNVAHDNEAPFPDKLPRFFIRSFCPPGGLVYDPFGGSGTTPAEAVKWGRRFIASDVRESQIKLMTRRLKEAWRLRDTQLVEEL